MFVSESSDATGWSQNHGAVVTFLLKFPETTEATISMGRSETEVVRRETGTCMVLRKIVGRFRKT